ncbi:ATP-dependent helicase HrpB [Geobacter sp. DSM 9736]|uniref:ATP-dependent helicase HrpB n=1 Tax=Geobacter sp. DSM 9736 TaxID=1277350 RepID=UPI000B50DBFF|nr:ATP-dependent helicase HrpB [Geobacter sp. DSM 9736]SNB45570.1 ATP-dependent helicase HrpB [Geobacter sp. DSM 9736]
MQTLPIQQILPEISAALSSHPVVIVHAPPGAGKTTCVPLALLNAPFLSSRKRIVMLEPRRLAATNAARWMASRLGEEVGNTVGYTIRFDRKISSSSRIEVVTEGILTRRLQDDPFLDNVGIVIFDEFHERSIHTDASLALCRDVQQGLREDLKIVIMSATLDCEPLASLLGGAPILSSPGRTFPVEIRYLEDKATTGIAEATAAGVRLALRETEGDVLVFLPGMAEITKCQQLINAEDFREPLLTLPLYGDLPFAAQERAILPGNVRKVVLATNIAETSLTIEGVSVVVDSGWYRQLRFDPVTGLNRLQTVRISSASAEQRCGRAGRLGPGICYRLWDEHTQRTLLPFSPPEIRTADLAPLALELAKWGVNDPDSLTWLDPPPVSALAEGRKLLMALGALDANGGMTSRGKEMAALPVHPRLAHLLLEGKDRGMPGVASDLAAILSERDIFRGGSTKTITTSESDLTDRLDALICWREKRSSIGLDEQACRIVDRVATSFRRLLKDREEVAAASSEIVGILAASAFPDRIGLLRSAGGDRYLLANGRGARLSGRSAVRGAKYLVAVAVDAGEGGEGLIHLATILEEASFRREFSPLIVRQRVVRWDSEEGRVVAREEERYLSLTLGYSPVVPSADEALVAVIEGIRREGLSILAWNQRASLFRDRMKFLSAFFPDDGWPDFSEEHLLRTVEEWLGPWLSGVRSRSDLSRLDLLSPLQGLLDWEQLKMLDEGAPPHIQVPSGAKIPLQYGADGPPVLAVKLQEMFGLGETPTVGWGRVPVILHLLSPARRPLQVTQDLKNFWNTTYQDVKKEMKGRYPKHPWPDDPWRALPTRHVSKLRK